MIKKADFKQKRILTIQAEYGHVSALNLTNDNIKFIKDQKVVNQVSCHLIFAIFIIGDLSITTSLLKKLNSLGISVFFLNFNLSLKATMLAEAEGNYLLRMKQYTINNSVSIAVQIVANKIISQEKVLKKTRSKYSKQIFEYSRVQLDSVNNTQQLLGIEGNVSKSYFHTLFAKLDWHRRAPQTKEDIPNMLLDIGYTYLFNYCDALLRLFGFDTYKGYYHQLFFQRKSLVCDVMEPIRPIIDYQVIKSFNLKQIKKTDFVFKNGHFEFKNGYQTSKHYSSIFLEAISSKQEDIYDYVRQFYLYCMDDKKYQFPQFNI